MKTDKQNQQNTNLFGTTSAMVLDKPMIQDAFMIESLHGGSVSGDIKIIMAQDDYGVYATVSSKVDTGFADPNRQRGFSPSGDGATTISSANFKDRELFANALIK